MFGNEQISELKRVDSVVGVKEIAKNDEVTSHVWHEEGNYIVSCTNTGRLIVSNLIRSEVSQKMHFHDAPFV